MYKCAYLDGIKNYLGRGAETAGDVLSGKGVDSGGDLASYLLLAGGAGALGGAGGNLMNRMDADSSMVQDPMGNWVIRKKKSPSLIGSAMGGALKGLGLGVVGAGVSNLVRDANTAATPQPDSESLKRRMAAKGGSY